MLLQPDGDVHGPEVHAECPRAGGRFQHDCLVWLADTCSSSLCLADDVVVFAHPAVLGLHVVELDAAKQTSTFIIHTRTLNQL